MHEIIVLRLSSSDVPVMTVPLRPALQDDAPAICAIYNPYVATTTITFEEEAVANADMAQRIADVGASGLPWLVAEVGGKIVGYAYATKWRVRPAYRYSSESTVYVDPAYVGQGIGRALYAVLLDDLRRRGLHVVIGGIAQPNAGSVALHEALGFRKVAHFAEVGMKFGRWIDVGYWQLNLDK
jgi:L-amino acid N-acyltransferase YncA